MSHEYFRLVGAFGPGVSAVGEGGIVQKQQDGLIGENVTRREVARARRPGIRIPRFHRHLIRKAALARPPTEPAIFCTIPPASPQN